MRITAIGLAIFAVYLPIAMLVHSGYVEVPRPSGKVVEMISAFDFDKPDRYVLRSYVFRPAKYPDASQISVYEDTTPLPRANIWFMVDAGDYVFRIRASDNSDPRANGRRYWLVLP